MEVSDLSIAELKEYAWTKACKTACELLLARGIALDDIPDDIERRLAEELYSGCHDHSGLEAVIESIVEELLERGTR